MKIIFFFTIISVLCSCSCSKKSTNSSNDTEGSSGQTVSSNTQQEELGDESNLNVSTALVSITEPIAGEPTGWFKRIRGTCSENDKIVSIVLGTINTTATCSGNEFEIHLDLSSFAVGEHSLSVTQSDSNNLLSTPATLTVNKIHGDCDSPVNRARNYAGGLAAGDGSVDDPYLVCSIEQFREMANTAPDDNFSLGNDLYFDFGDSNGDGVVDGSDTDYGDGTSWVPFSMSDAGMVGERSFSGKNFAIHDFYLNTPGSDAALFSAFRYRLIRDLKISNAVVIGTNAAAISASCSSSLFYNVQVSGEFTGSNDAAGVCAHGGRFIRVQSEGTIAAGRHAGGIAGWIGEDGAVISESKFTGSVSGDNSVGGLVGLGYTWNMQVFNSYVNATITGNHNVGGIAGSSVNVYNSYFNGRVEEGPSPTSSFGGIVGHATWDRVVLGSISAGEVFAPNATNVGQVYGENSSPLVSGYYLGSATCTGSVACNNGGTARASLTDLFSSSNAPVNTWDFVGSTTDGYSDSWQASSSSATPYEFWWESEFEISPPFTGSGTLADPFIISNEADLEKISSNNRWMDASFRIGSNLDLSTITYRPIAYQSVYFGREFDGNDRIISNLSLAETNYMPLGFFGRIQSSTIKDLSLTGVNLSSPGGLVASLAAVAISATISRIAAAGAVSAGRSYSGGLIAQMYWSSVMRSSSNVTVNGRDNVGGLIGMTNHTAIGDCYSLGDVTGTAGEVGGLIGHRSYLNTYNSFATGNVSGMAMVGGLIGRASAGSFHEFDNNFATGDVSGNSAASDVGHLIGFIDDGTGSSGNDFYSGHTCTNAGAGGPGCNSYLVGGGQGSEAYFYDASNAPLSAWDFTGIWLEDGVQSAYPTLR